MEFEWDPQKDVANQSKHEVMFSEAASVFADPLAWTIPDPDHSESEYRYFTTTSERRLVIVAHTYRGDTIRIISARRATRRERKVYEEGE
ncbi:MAG: BrnT family toxin [Acidobacteria bacterium]|nr:BrnT family toxin [Acidobacteriota bacterium]